MAAGVLNLDILQGETFSRVITLTSPSGASTTTNAAGYAVGSVSITCPAGGVDTLLAGEYVKFGTDTKLYKVATGIASLVTGGTMVLESPGLTTAIPASATAVTVYAPINLTGFTASAQIRQTADASQIAATFTCTISPTPTDGAITLGLTAEETSAIGTPGERYYNNLAKYTWDMELDSGGTVLRLFNGLVYVSPEVTR